jgi:hypothetical protein
MYSRVRQAGLNQYVGQYGVHVALAVSLALIGCTRPSNPVALTKADMDGFARTVTNNLLDTSYSSYHHSTMALTGELGPHVQQMLAKAGMLALSLDELNAQEKSLQDLRQVSSVRVDEVNVGEPDANRNGLVPLDVKGAVAIHSSEEQGTPQPFRFRYWVGKKANAQHQPEMDANGKPELVVADFEDLSSTEKAAPSPQ